MCDVTRQNFEAKFDEIANRIRESAFVAIDCEFTALNVAEGGGTLANSDKNR